MEQPPKPKAHNRRIAPRRLARRSTKVTCRKGTLGLGPNLAVSLLDVSEGGVRLILKAALEKGQEVEVGLLPPGKVREVLRKGEVAWSVPGNDGTYCVGIRFARRLEYAVLSDLGTAAAL